uniref:Uncharacterized protein n=1 Tax=Arundo donax TaxID=35708 RepID=A0A0A8YP12_ARUDO
MVTSLLWCCTMCLNSLNKIKHMML